MASFNIAKATGMGFSYVWKNRYAVTRMALVPFALKWVTFVLVIATGLENNHLRQGLLMIPSYFFEGWLVAYFVRLAVYNENIFTLSAGEENARQRNKAILDSMLAGSLLYVLLNLMTSLLWGLIPPQPQEPSLGMFILAMGALYATIWAVRILWMHVAVILGFNLKDYLVRLQGLQSSVFILATWVLCVMPLAITTFIFADFLALLFRHSPESPSMAFHFIMLGVQSAVEIIINLVGSIAIGLGICSMMRPSSEREKKI